MIDNTDKIILTKAGLASFINNVISGNVVNNETDEEILNAIDEFSDAIVFNDSNYASNIQGELAETALQSVQGGDNIKL